jgi:predicted aspartyl protease
MSAGLGGWMNRLQAPGFRLRAWTAVLVLLAACGHEAPSIPIQIENNLVLVDVGINGLRPAAFILDTAAGASVLDRADLPKFQLRSTGQTEATTGGGSVAAGNVANVTFDINGIKLTADALAVHLDNLEGGLGHSLDGILGYDVFKAYVVEIDYIQKTIRLNEPATYRYGGREQPLAISIEEQIPFIRLPFENKDGKAVQGKVEFDIGQTSGLLLIKTFVDENQLIPALQQNVQITTGAILADKVSAYVTRIPALRLGETVMKDIVTTVSLTAENAGVEGDTVGLLGAEVLRRFKVIVDYSRSQVFLEPNRNINDPFEFDMSGMSLAAQGVERREYRVRSVIRDTPAAEAGVSAGDLIVTIDNRPARELTLTEIRRLFRQPDRELVLNLKRSAQSMRVTLKTRRLV